MAKLSTTVNPGDASATIDVDGVVVGGIQQTGKGTFSAQTNGRIPAIDGASGGPVREVHDKIARRIRAGGVTLSTLIMDADHAQGT